MTHGDSRWLIITSEHFYRWNFRKKHIFDQKRGNLEIFWKNNRVNSRSISGRIEVKSGGQIWPPKKYIFPKLVFFEILENIFERGDFFVIFYNSKVRFGTLWVAIIFWTRIIRISGRMIIRHLNHDKLFEKCFKYFNDDSLCLNTMWFSISRNLDENSIDDSFYLSHKIFHES